MSASVGNTYNKPFNSYDRTQMSRRQAKANKRAETHQANRRPAPLQVEDEGKMDGRTYRDLTRPNDNPDLGPFILVVAIVYAVVTFVFFYNAEINPDCLNGKYFCSPPIG